MSESKENNQIQCENVNDYNSLTSQKSETKIQLIEEIQDLERKTYFGIQLKRNYTLINVLSIPHIAFFNVLFIQNILILTFFLFEDTSYFSLDQSKIAKYMNDMIFYISFINLFLIFAVGYLYDHVGRKWLIFSLIMITSLTTFLFPYSGPSIYPWYFSLRVFFGVATFSMIENPLLTDYVKKNSRGKAQAMQSFGQSFGYLSGIVILFNALKNVEIGRAHQISAFLTACFAVSTLFMVKERRIHECNLNASERLKSMILAAKQEIIKNQEIKSCFIGLLIAKFCVGISMTFQLIWVMSFVGNSSSLSTKQEGKDAYILLSLVSTSIQLLFTFKTGEICDKYSSKLIIPIFYSICGLSLICIPLIDHPLSVFSFLIQIMVSCSSQGVVISITSYYKKQISSKVRVAMISWLALIETVSKIISIKIGGELIVAFGVNSPFIMIGGAHLIFVFYILIQILRGKFGEGRINSEKVEKLLSHQDSENQL